MGNTFQVNNDGSVKLKDFSSDPSGEEGMMIYNSTDKKMKFYDGTAWVDA